MDVSRSLFASVKIVLIFSAIVVLCLSEEFHHLRPESFEFLMNFRSMWLCALVCQAVALQVVDQPTEYSFLSSVVPPTPTPPPGTFFITSSNEKTNGKSLIDRIFGVWKVFEGLRGRG